MIEMDETEFLESDFSDDALRLIAALCGWRTAHNMLLPPPVPIRPEGVRSGACMMRFWKWLTRFGRTASR